MNFDEINFIQKNYKKLNEADLVIRAQQDDFKALEELIRREQNHIYVTLKYLENKNIDALDLTQDVLFKMSQNIKKLRNPRAFKSWLNQITMHVFYDTLRKKNKSLITVSIDEDLSNINSHIHSVSDIQDNNSKPDEYSMSNELDKKIQQSITNLPLNFRLPIILREYQGLSYEEIANSLNTSIGTIKSRIARARNKLQEELKVYLT